MSVRLHCSLRNQKVAFEPRQPPAVGFYVCGVTVYDLCHLGHARCYVVWDVVRRHLLGRGYDVRYVRNVTDVDDKILKRAVEQNQDPRALAEHFVAEMRTDFDRLGIDAPTVEPRATEHIAEMKDHISALIEKELAYEAEGDVYFDVAHFPSYGELAHQSLAELLAGARVELSDKKRSPYDFALWKSAKPNEPSAWDSPWGPGRPGWHIECSAMAAKHLGPRFDLHAGGMDLLFPHHQNELAQSEGRYGPGSFAKYWMHNGFLNTSREKMSKSLGNVLTIRQVTQTHDAEALRLFLLGVHYRGPIQIDVEVEQGKPHLPGVAEAERRLEYYYTTQARLNQAAPAPGPPAPEAERFLAQFEEAMDDDFNTAVALATMGEAAAFANQLLDGSQAMPRPIRQGTLGYLQQAIATMGGRLGLLRRDPLAFALERRARVAAQRNVDEREVDTRVAERDAARRAKDFARADAIRNELGQKGIDIMDGRTGTSWRFRS